MVNKDWNYIFDVELAERSISLANELTIGEGEERQPLKTRGFQNFIIGSLHGWRVKRSNKLRFREAYIQMGRQNGKSMISGTEANNRASFSGYELGRIFCAATKQDQANIVWDEVAKFIQTDPELADLYQVRNHDRTITSKITGTYIKSVGRDTKSIDGFRTVLSIIDEYHAHPTNQMYSLLLKGQAEVKSPLMLAITTAGFNLQGPCYAQYKFCKNILTGLVKKESQFIYIAEMDYNKWTDADGVEHEPDDIWDYRNWAKANPFSLWIDDVTIDMEKVARRAEIAVTAKEKGGEDLVDFLTKDLNVWVTNGGHRFVDETKLQLCASNLTLEDMRGRKCYVGLDLSSGGDLTSVGLVFPLDGEDEFFIESHSFMPELRLQEHERTDDAPYRIWVREGLMTLTSGAFGIKTDYKAVLQWLEDTADEYDLEILEIGYDAYNAGAFLGDLENIGAPMTEVKQSARNLNDATVDLQLSINGATKEKQLVRYNKKNDLLAWSLLNAVTVTNSFKELKVDKESDGARIDPVDAIIDGWKVMFLNKSVSDGYDPDEAVDDWAEMMAKRRERR